jgi:Signal transduction histidine kinase
LRPKALDDFGLVPALERLVETFVEATGIRVDFESRLGDDPPVVRGRDDPVPGSCRSR